MHGRRIQPLPGFSDALVILGAAGIVIPAFARLRISPIIGFILIGVLVGPSMLGALTGQYPWLNYVTISNPEAIEPFAELGIILLLFSIGLELSFRRLWSMRRLVFGVGAAELIGCAAILGLGLYLIGQSIAGRGRARPGAGAVLDRARHPAGRHPRPGRPLGAWRCCCSRMSRWCRSSSCSARWRPPRPTTASARC